MERRSGKRIFTVDLDDREMALVIDALAILQPDTWSNREAQKRLSGYLVALRDARNARDAVS